MNVTTSNIYPLNKSSNMSVSTEETVISFETSAFISTEYTTAFAVNISTASTMALQPNIDRLKYLDMLSDKMATRVLPVIVYLGILMVVGVLGNCLVLYVHIRKFKPSTTRTYVLSLAVFDLLSCFISIPGEITDLRYAFTFTAESLCKAERFCTTFASLASGFTLMAVAVDRYKRICRPLKQQLATRGARKSVVVTSALSLLFSWPVIVIYGSKEVDTEYPNITGTECSTDEFFKSTRYPVVYTGILFLTFIISFGTMTILYTLIGRRIFHQKKFRKDSTYKGPDRSRTLSDGDKTPSSPTIPKSNSFPSEQDRPSYDEGHSEYSIASVDPYAKSVSLTRKPSLLKRFTKSTRDAMTRKTTFMLFLITLVFVLSFLPHLILKVVQSLRKDFLEDVSTAGLIFYNVFVRSYFINSISNAFIYGFCSPRFRKESKSLFKTLICKKKCDSMTISKENANVV